MNVETTIQVATLNAALEVARDVAIQRKGIIAANDNAVLARVRKLTVTETSQLHAAVGTGKALVSESLDHLEELGFIKQLPRHIVDAKADEQTVAEAYGRCLKADYDSRFNSFAPVRRQRYNKGLTELEYAHVTPLEPTEQTHYSENPTFGNSYETAMQAEPLDAELPTWESEATADREIIPVGGFEGNRISKEKYRLVLMQRETGQGFRNARKAAKRYYIKNAKAASWVEQTQEF
jgi:hypothetical protein